MLLSQKQPIPSPILASSSGVVAPGAASCLRAEGVGHRFQPNWRVLNDVGLELRHGELVGLVGPNGAGKTTLLRVMAGLIAPTVGRATLDGKPLASWARRALARRVGLLPQGARPSVRLSVEEVVAQGRYPHQRGLGLLGPADVAAVRRAMQRTRSLAFARRDADELSSGERQMVMLASALAQETDFLLLDEPTSNLDLRHQALVFELARDLARQGLGVLAITHDLNLAATYCDRVALLSQGRLTAIGAPAEALREDLLREAYETDLTVARNPVTGGPMVLIGRSAERQEGREEDSASARQKPQGGAPWPS